mmetsp:Transcript_32869/g.74202  ORF Transcript_32869/g.74202 Transcript_32869/m.74202 type:complete len:132 (+) Transcript_32869:1020-1415(+)
MALAGRALEAARARTTFQGIFNVIVFIILGSSPFFLVLLIDGNEAGNALGFLFFFFLVLFAFNSLLALAFPICQIFILIIDLISMVLAVVLLAAGEALGGFFLALAILDILRLRALAEAEAGEALDGDEAA